MAGALTRMLGRSSAASSTFVGALVHLATSVGGTTYLFDAEDYDTTSIHSLVTNTDRMIMPAGTALARAIGREHGSGASTPQPAFRKNGATFLGRAEAVTQDDVVTIATGPVVMSSGDYFDMTKGGLGTPDTAGGIWMGVEVLDSATKYAVVSKTANQALTGGVSTTLTWDSEVADTNAFHDNVTNNSRLTVPSGVTRVKLVANLKSTSNVNTTYIVQITKNGTFTGAGCVVTCSTFTGLVNLSTALLEVTPGDYFELVAISTNAQTVATADTTWFSIFEMPDVARTLVKKVATQAVTSGTPAALVFGTGATVYDTANAHDESTNNTRITVQSGITKAKLSFAIITASATGIPFGHVRKNGSASAVPGLPGFNVNVTGAEFLNGEGAWIDVVAGDYFELFITPGANQTLPIDNRTWFAAEFLP